MRKELQYAEKLYHINIQFTTKYYILPVSIANFALGSYIDIILKIFFDLSTVYNYRTYILKFISQIIQ